MKTLFSSTWYPFRSREVKSIIESLTEEKRIQIKEEILKQTKFDTWLPLSIALLCAFFRDKIFAFILFVFPVLLIYSFIKFAPLRKRIKEILCDTEYARINGLTPENIRLYSFQKKSPQKALEHGST